MSKTITIMVVADVVGILASDSLEGNLYLYDNNRAGGSVGEGTEHLKTRLKFERDHVNLLWNVMSLEPESYACISRMMTCSKDFTITPQSYPESDITYWKGTIKETCDQPTYYLSLKVGNSEKEYTCKLSIERIN